MTIQEFKLIDPGNEYIMVYYTGSPTASITAVNLAAVDCRGTNISVGFHSLTQITLPFNGSTYTLDITGRTIYTNYAHFTVSPVSVPTSNLTNEGNCTDFITVPNLQSTLFQFSDYQAILNNASANRTTGFIFDVDRNKLEIAASNIEAINAGSATLASYQELNYSSIGITNSRYVGSKTSTAQYGISPAFTGTVVDASLYTANQSNGFICSQSIDSRVVDEIIVGYDASATPSFDGDIQYADDIKINYIDLAKFYFTSGSDLNSGATTLTLNAFIDVYPEDIIRLKQGTLLNEVMKVQSVISKTSSESIFTVTRAYKSDVDPNNIARTFYKNGILGVSRLTGTQFFKADGNRLYKLSNKKVWIKENSKIFYVDEKGQVIFELITCSI